MRYFLAVIPIALVLMLVGLLAGIFRLASMHGIAFETALVKLYAHHGEVMLFGFLAPLILTERYAGSLILDVPRAVHALPFLAALGALLKFVSWITAQSALNVLGTIALGAGIILYVYLLLFLSKRAVGTLPFKLMGLAAVLLLLSALLTLRIPSKANLPLALLMLGFPVLTILGERLDMAKFVPQEMQRRAENSFILAVLSALLLLASIAIPSNYLLFAAVLSLAAAAVPIFQIDMAVMRKAKAGLQGYLAAHLRVAYFWLFLGLALLLAISLRGYSIIAFDAATHSIAVGFIGTMILAHAPIIAPSLLGFRLQEEKLSYVPLFFLTLGTVLRVGGEVSLGVSKLSGYSGFLILLMLFSFAATMIRALKKQ